MKISFCHVLCLCLVTTIIFTQPTAAQSVALKSNYIDEDQLSEMNRQMESNEDYDQVKPRFKRNNEDLQSSNNDDSNVKLSRRNNANQTRRRRSSSEISSTNESDEQKSRDEDEYLDESEEDTVRERQQQYDDDLKTNAQASSEYDDNDEPIEEFREYSDVIDSDRRKKKSRGSAANGEIRGESAGEKLSSETLDGRSGESRSNFDKSNEASSSYRQSDQQQMQNSASPRRSDNSISSLGSSSGGDPLQDKSSEQQQQQQQQETSAEYERRVQDFIESKINAIKEEIKRQVEQQQQIDNINFNNAKYEELQSSQEDEDEENESLDSDSSNFQRNVRINEKQENSGLRPHESVRKRSAFGSPVKKINDNDGEAFVAQRKKQIAEPRQVYIVNRRQAHPVKRRQLDAADANEARVNSPLDKSLQDAVGDDVGRRKRSKSRLSASGGGNEANWWGGEDHDRGSAARFIKDHQQQMRRKRQKSKRLAGRGKRSRERLAGNEGVPSYDEMSPKLESEYSGAFGGLQRDSSGSLVRFKRIKRVT